jgi:hypothetical protein
MYCNVFECIVLYYNILQCIVVGVCGFGLGNPIGMDCGEWGIAGLNRIGEWNGEWNGMGCGAIGMDCGEGSVARLEWIVA